MRIIDGQRIETECTSCCMTFTTDRDEDGWPAQELCSECRETLHEVKHAMMAEMEAGRLCMEAAARQREWAWWETFLSFPFKQLPAPRCEDCDYPSFQGKCWECGACREHCDCEDGFYECTCEYHGDEQIPWDCRIHSKYGTETRRQREQEAADEASFFGGPELPTGECPF